LHRIPSHLGPKDLVNNRAAADVIPNIPIVLMGEAGVRPLTNDEWAEAENEKGHYCKCGCGEKITVLPRHRAPTVGIPSYKHGKGHHKMDMTAFVSALNAEGFLTVAQAASELGVSENTLRRAEGHGWISPEWREWGNRRPMRIYAKADIPKLREQMVNAGFRFKDEKGVMTTREMAKLLSVAESTLRRAERLGRIPTQSRDTNGKRKWKRGDVRKLKRLLARSQSTLRVRGKQ
jgi:DNA-binding transcriptional MerR regulator